MAGISIYITLMYYFNVTLEGYEVGLEEIIFMYTAFIGIVISIFCSIFIGTDYSDGTIRNKMLIGHSRSAIYFSNLITCSISSILMCIAYIIPMLILGFALVGGFVENISIVLLRLLCSIVLIIAFSALFNLVSMLINSKAISAIVCLLSMFILLFGGIYIESSLSQPEVYPGYVYIENGETISEEETPNPHYLRGTKREVYEFLNDFLPGGQSMQIKDVSDIKHMGLLELYSGIIIVVATGAGVIFFRRKDLK